MRRYLITLKNGKDILCNKIIFSPISGDLQMVYLIIDNSPTDIQVLEGASSIDVITTLNTDISTIREIEATDDTLDYMLELMTQETCVSSDLDEDEDQAFRISYI